MVKAFTIENTLYHNTSAQMVNDITIIDVRFIYCALITKKNNNQIMKNTLFTIMYIGFILALVSIAITNIYMMGFAELLVIPSAIKLFILNYKK